ncbi:hypothetical protein [Nitrincola tapanii]|uniref:Uncharacterized protein n=1 Tax=Nitrincola tapanii TaxID=1708751 RepID=A0A5A9W232_9GAMM|nr:hypothetical protein [Nitrincola tapanii]KAA0874786.1 hypothetical protein E1H14_08210 [Nitrincola tapanii]
MAKHDLNIEEMTMDAVLALLSSKQNPTLSWPMIGQAIRRLELLGYPKQRSGGQHWLEQLVEPIGIKRTAAWRYRAIAKDWPWLRRELLKQAIDAPVLDQLEPTVSAEQVEILIRVVRATPPEIWKAVAERVLHRAISLREIRCIWSHHRPVLRGKTARGRGSRGFVESVAVDEQLPETQGARFKGLVCQLLEMHYPAILEQQLAQRLLRYRFDSNTQELEVMGIALDAVCSVLPDGHRLPLIHGFVIMQDVDNTHALYQRFAALAPFVDVLWLVAPQAVELNGSVGLIISDGVHIQGVHASEPSHVLAQEALTNPLVLRWQQRMGMQMMREGKR